jgi:hypothetical protein
MIATGILLHLKKDVAWIQPPELRGTGDRPGIPFEAALAACRTVPGAGVETWRDIQRIDVRPSRGMMKVLARSGWEIQVDAGTGAVLQAAYRRSDLLEGIHDGSFFHEGVKRWIFLPSGAALLVLWLTGLVLFLQPLLRRRTPRAAGGNPRDAPARPSGR